MKRNVLKEASSDFKLINIDVTRKENSMGSAAIKLHTTTSNLLLKSSCFKEKKIKFLGDCAVILMNIMLKLQERSPVNSVMVRKEAFQEIFQVLRSLIFLIFDLTIFSAHISTEQQVPRFM